MKIAEALRDDGPCGRAAGRDGLVDFLVCLAVTTAWAARALPRLNTHLRDAYDAQIQVWAVSWVRHALVHAPLSVFDANIFAPARNTLAFTEPLIGYGAAGLPLSAAGLSDVGVVNMLCLLGTAFSVWAISRLAVSYGCPRLPALLGAAAAALGADAASAFGYVYFVVGGGVALVLLAWKILREKPGSRSSLALAAAVAGLAWFSLQLFAFGAAALGVVVFFDLVTEPESRSRAVLARLAAALALAALLIAPLAWHMLEARLDNGFRRDEAEAASYSASPRDWLTTTSSNPGQAFLSRRSESERPLYPGTAALALAAIALVIHPRARARLVATGAILVALGFLGSLGPKGPVVPVLAAAVPFVFSGIRAFTRFSVVARVGFGLLAAAGCAALLERVRARAARAGVGALLSAGIALDVRQSVRFGFRPELPHPPVEILLARTETRGPILHLPLYHAPGDARWLFGSLAHFKPLVNGYSSHVPRRNEELAATLASERIPPDAIPLLADWPTGVVVVHEHALPLDQLRPTMRLMETGLAEGAFESPTRLDHLGGDDWVFFVRHGPDSAMTEPDSSDARLFHEHAAASPAIPRFEDAQFPASIDVPVENEVVHGELLLRGWSQTPEGPGEVVEIRIDADRRGRLFLGRTPRPDVAAVLPALGSCAAAGYEARFEMLPGDEATHELHVVFRATDGRLRTLSRSFEWAR